MRAMCVSRAAAGVDARRERSSDASGTRARAISRAPRWLDDDATTNPALSGNFAPVEGELEAPVACVVARGRLPSDLDGLYLRNGPNARFRPALGTNRYHWFDGDGMVHALRLRGEGERGEYEGERAEYTRRYVRTRGFEREEKANAALYTGLRDINPIWRYLLPRLLEKMTLDVRQPDSAFFVIQSKNTSSNGLTHHAGRLLATYESGSPYEIALEPTLRTKGLCDFNQTFGTMDYWLDNFTAHSKTCPMTDELIYIGYNLVALSGEQDGQTTITVGVIDGETGKRTHRRQFKVPRPSMQHDVAITPTKTVLIDGPLIFNLPRVIEGGLPFSFERECTLRIGYLPRKGEEGPFWIDTGETCFAYHVVNAYEEGNVLTLDVCKADETNALGMCQESNTPRSTPAKNPVNAGRDVAALWRWQIDTDANAMISSKRLCEQTSDFPCINRKYTGLKYRFAYSVAYKLGTEPKSRMDIPLFDAVLKHDLQSGVTTRYELGEGVTCGDIIFVPSKDAAREDDGYLLVLTHLDVDDEEPRAELLVLDASGDELTTQCVVHIPVRVPYGFHCEYVPGPLPDWPL